MQRGVVIQLAGEQPFGSCPGALPEAATTSKQRINRENTSRNEGGGQGG
eukprot:CAMPEP_0171092948 /NCGR_PEP_ID=MMETSP0766_2-20121228/38297_1 /TAXON_ID=439317 /ORGANISM="Gambierdiscus australes, Strain CAWD 149" /LENGTH=48 /DNA_ID= /DNA_START= /DNA_END= /DNA_ORIENTATION=